MDLEEMTGQQLLARYNPLCERTGMFKSLTSTKNTTKAELIERIKEMSLADPKLVQDKLTKQRKMHIWSAFKHETIRETSLELLCHEDFTNNDGRTVGLPYSDILNAVRELFPDCETSLECLRWYAVKVRANERNFVGYKLPQVRPRSPQKRKPKDE